MKKSKFLALLLVATLMLSLGGTVLAADEVVETAGTTTIKIPSTLQLPTIKVTIAAPSDVVLNPYKMSVTTPVSADDTVISVPSLITNNSTIDMTIKAAPTVTVNDTVKVLTTAPNGTFTEKSIYMALHMSNSANSTITSYTGVDTTDFTNHGLSVVKKDTEGNSSPCSITLDADPGSTPSYGVYLIKGESGGGGWESPADKATLNLVFDIQPAALSS